MANTSIIWPEVFTNPDFSYTGEDDQFACAVADGLSGWACCYMEMRPEGFGKGMAKIHTVIGQLPIEENLRKLADKILNGGVL